MRYLFLAGEASGDLHAAGVIRYLKELEPEAEIHAMGGDQMVAAGATIILHIRGLGFMGFSQLWKKAFVIRKTFALVKKEILDFRPDLIVPVDFGGFNLRMIRWASRKGFRSVYYIPPKVWAWMPGRSRKLARYCERVICILPFEPDFLKKFGVAAEYGGNPVRDYTMDQKGAKDQQPSGSEMRKVIALLPGSRDQEIRTMLPVMASTVSDFPDYEFVIAGCEPFSDEYYRKYTPDNQLQIVRGKTLDVLSSARAALVTSGTATLEAALVGVPQVVCYKTSAFSYVIAKALIRVRFISLVNLILDRELVRELIQEQLNANNVVGSLRDILEEDDTRTRILAGYQELRLKLGESGAYRMAAGIVRTTAVKP
jgi:lipid-A-disaccharide synthase